MLLRKWENLPSFMQTEEVRPYYDLLDSKRGQLLFKRCFDIVAAFILIIILSPIMFFVAIWIRLDSKGSVFFRQERVTQYGKTFRIYKFRTMVLNAEYIGSSVTSLNDSRITKVGCKIRTYRLDEIPQLFNVLSGDMTFVGTRPEVKEYVGVYTNEMFATLLLPAGITSKASIKFKDEDIVLVGVDNTEQIYTDVVLPKKMVINLNSILKFSCIDDFKICMETILGVRK